jgi:dipeptidyl aminopeptidase/acylaminoacyl peptidase
MGRSRIALEDLYRLRSLRQLALSPDGQRAVVVVEEARRGPDDRMTHLYLIDLTGRERPHALTRGSTRDTSPAWSPDGRYLAFLSSRPDESEVAATLDGDSGDGPKGSQDKPDPEDLKSQLWVFDLAWGGEPRQLTSRPEGVDSFSWSPDGRSLVFSARDPSPEQAAYLRGIRDKKRPKPWVLTRTQHKADGEGFLDDVPRHLFIVDAADRRIRQLTHGSLSETAPRWSPDGRWILFVSNRTGDADNNERRDLWLISPDGAEVRRLTRGDVGVGAAVFSPDGSQVAFVSALEPENLYRLQHVLIVDVASSVPVADLATCVGEGWSSVGGIVPDGTFADPVAAARVYPKPLERTPARILTEGAPGPAYLLRWPTANRIWAMAGDHGQWRLMACDPSGGYEFRLPRERMGTVMDFDAVGDTVVVVMDRPDTAPEVYRWDGEGTPVLVSAFHSDWIRDRDLANVRWVAYRDHDGVPIEALVHTPPGFVAGDSPPAPLLVAIHGGPMSFDAPGFDFDAQYWAALGYVVLQVNYRGSISYGEDFCRSIQGRWGPMEHDDVMCGIDELIRLDYVDPDRLYCTGFSQGGIMTNWAVGHTDRFRAAVTEHGMWNYVSAFGTDDCHLWWQDDLGVPWQNPEGYYRISPMSGVANIRTPLLITAGAEDWRCPLDQAEQLYLALKKRGVDTALVVYPGEHHAITRPSRAVDRLSRIVAWLARYGGPADPAAPPLPGPMPVTQPSAREEQP